MDSFRFGLNCGLRSLQPCARAGSHGGAAVPHQQMRVTKPAYPVDRYLVRGSKSIEFVNINDDDVWAAAPALRPEDELMLNKLHCMLQSTTEELKTLSDDMARYREPVVQVKALPTPLDQAFNEKVRIEQLINAKFLGQTILEPTKPNITIEKQKNINQNARNVSNACVQVNIRPRQEIQKGKLGLSQTRVVQVQETLKDIGSKISKENDIKKQTSNAVAYSEIAFKENDNITLKPLKNLLIQDLPKINIRGELKHQKIFNFDIAPETQNNNEPETTGNIAVVELKQVPKLINKPTANSNHTEYHQPNRSAKRHTRKTLKLSTCESSESAEQMCHGVQSKLNSNKPFRKYLVRSNASSKGKYLVSNKQNQTRSFNIASLSSLPKNKTLNTMNSKPATNNTFKSKINQPSSSFNAQLNNKDYVPYSKLTLGGFKLKDIEKEQRSLGFDDIPLSPILNKIINDQGNTSSDGDSNNFNQLPILSTSDEHILENVPITKTRNNTAPLDGKTLEEQSNVSINNDNSSEKKYDDDFEDPAATDVSGNSGHIDSQSNSQQSAAGAEVDVRTAARVAAKDTTFTKISNLSFKDNVDVIEFIHSIDKQDSATQSLLPQNKLSETQTSPRSSRANIQPIHNDLWPMDNDSDFEVKDIKKMFKLEKDMIKQLIIEEYGDVLKRVTEDFSKPSSNAECSSKNNKASQKNTQTSPARVKSVMTSPNKVKSRATSPFTRERTVDHQTSPMLLINSREATEQPALENLGLTMNLSSPRYSLELPQNSHEVLMNLRHVDKHRKSNAKTQTLLNTSTSIDVDCSSSDISSLGEIKLKLQRKNINVSRYALSCTTSTSSSTSSESQESLVLPVKSEGELTSLNI